MKLMDLVELLVDYDRLGAEKIQYRVTVDGQTQLLDLDPEQFIPNRESGSLILDVS